jgi:hypothetical protein
MRRLLTLVAAVVLSTVFTPSAAMSNRCESPSDFVVKVHSTQSDRIEYEFKQDRNYRKIQVMFFGKKDHVMRKDTILDLASAKGTFTIPAQALLAPAQLWFNFVITDDTGCKSWGLVNEVATATKGNFIAIDSPSGEGKSFYIKRRN